MGTYHPRLEGGSRAICSETIRPILLTVTEERLAVHYSRFDALMMTRDPGGVPKEMFQDFFLIAAFWCHSRRSCRSEE